MENCNQLWSEFCRSGSIMSYLSYKQTVAVGSNSNELEQELQK